MLGDLTGKRALVTGAGRGIGQGIAVALAEQGAAVAVTDLRAELTQETVAQIEGETLVMALDVTDIASVDDTIGSVISQWGALDILVNNAGGGAPPGAKARENSDDAWDFAFAMNVKSAVHCCDAVIPHMKERRYGKIINIGSTGAHASFARSGPYFANKAAVLRYTKGLARELGSYNINVNAICPGAVWGPSHVAGALQRQSRDPSLSGKTPEEIFRDVYVPDRILSRTELPVDIGKMAAFLASDDTQNVTGQCLHVDGGMTLRD